MRLTTSIGLLVATSAAVMGCSAGDSIASAPSSKVAPTKRALDTPGAPSPPEHGLHHVEVLTGGARTDERLPMIVILHGLGDRPRPELWTDFPKKARWILPQAPTPWGGGYSWFPFRAADDDPNLLATGIASSADRIAALVGELSVTKKTRGKPIVAGFSQGGMLSFALALRHPGLWKLVVPTAGLLPEPLWPARVRVSTNSASLDAFDPAPSQVPPIHALHGDADDIVPLTPTRELIEALGEAGYPVDLRTFAGVGHEITQPMFDALYELLIEATE